MNYIYRLLDTTAPDASLRHAAYALVVASACGWLTFALYRPGLNGDWVLAMTALLGAVTTGKIANNAVDLGKLIAAVQQSLCPTGTILAFAGDAAPPGWQLCDSTFLNRTTYAALFAVVGTRFGYGDSTNFRVPDFRGRFLRGRDGGVGLDPDRAARTAMNAGGAVGDLVGSVQGDMFAAHNHSLPLDSQGGGLNMQSMTDSGGSDENWSMYYPTGWNGGNETRAKNANVNFIIKL